jgi:dermatan 4-sulfotransferase 1
VELFSPSKAPDCSVACNATDLVGGSQPIASAEAVPFFRAPTIPVIPNEPNDAREYQLRPEKIGYSMYYGGRGAYLYQPIPKNACTSIKTLLLEVEGLPVDDNSWYRHQKEYNGFPGTNHLPLEEQLDVFEGRTDTFKFVFVRNPYARLASAYSDKLGMNLAPHIVRKIGVSAAQHGIALSKPITFPELVSVVCRQSLAEMDFHYRPQYYEGRFEIVKYDFVGRMETLDADLTYVLKRIGAADTVVARAHQRLNGTGSSAELWENVPADVHQLFLKVFGIDFDVLQYPRRLPELRPN